MKGVRPLAKDRAGIQTILYIDQSESHRLLMQMELSEEGFQVFTAENMEEAIAKWRTIDPDLIILELRQNRLNGEVFERLRGKYPKVRWIGYSTYFQCPEEFAKWIDFYLPKTTRIEEMKTVIQRLRVTGVDLRKEKEIAL